MLALCRSWLFLGICIVLGAVAFLNTTSLDVGAGAPCLGDDPFEENDSSDAANKITLPFDEQLCLFGGDDDWVAFPVSQGGDIEVNALFTDANGDVDIYLRDPNGAAVTAGISTTDNELIEHTALMSGLYRLRATLFDDPDGNGNVYDLAIRTGCPDPTGAGTTFSDALTAPLPVPDGNPVGITNCIAIPAAGVITDLNVDVNLTHTYVGDLTVLLKHEDTGTVATIIDRPGHPGAPCSQNDIDAVLDDEAFSPVESECFAGTPAISGTFIPNGALSVFDGESMAGDWTLRVIDAASSDLGTLNSWSIIATVLPPTATPTATNTSTPTPTPTPTFTPTPTDEPTATSTSQPTNTPAPTKTPTATLTPTRTNTPIPAKAMGDANDDGSVDSIDAALVLQLTAGLVVSVENPASADVNDDGEINPLDAALILQFVAGLIPGLPV
jgi:subtilisin-like proprotein convertase family protein